MPAEVFMAMAAAKATVVIGAALLVVVCAPRASAALRHAVLLAGMIGALAVPLLGATLPPFSPPSVFGSDPLGAPGQGRIADNVFLMMLTRTDTESVVPVGSTLRSGVESGGPWILGVWVLGTAIVLVRIGADLAAARRVVARAAGRTRVGPGVPLLESAEIGSPVVVGLFRPVILLPAGSALDSSARRSVITHELGHVERRDCLTKLVARLGCALYWFNPLFWWAARRIALERERACDDRVLVSGVSPFAYSEFLVRMARRSMHLAVRHQAMSSMAHAAHLERRIVSILSGRASRLVPSRRRRLALALAASVVVVPVAALGVHDGPPPEAGSDPYFDPGSERLGGDPVVDASAVADPTTPNGALIETLRRAAARVPSGPHDLVPERARWALSLVRDGVLIEPLLAALRDPDWRVRGYAAWSLGLAGEVRAVEPLVALLDDPVWRLRAMAATALREIGSPAAAEALAEALADPAWQVRVEAVAYLRDLRDPRYRDALRRLELDPHVAIRLAAAEALDPR